MPTSFTLWVTDLSSSPGHNELIQAGGYYSRLVESQKLREVHHVDDGFGDWNKNMEKEAREEVPLGRKNTDHSLASDIEQQKQAHHEEDQHHGLPYLFKRMFLIIRDHWKL
jgi:ATP-binding cassette subfamily B (MDR/TAP) protein 1